MSPGAPDPADGDAEGDGPAYAVLIPARFGSTRLPGKVLLAESGKYLVQHTQERALAAPGHPQVVVLTDDDRVEAAVRSYGGEVLRTRADHVSGTDRCAEALATLSAPVVVNLQADEPLLAPADLARLAAAAARDDVDIATLAHPFEHRAHEADENAVKALVGPDGFATDFVREAPSAARRAGPPSLRVLHHLGVYAWRRERLRDFATLPPSPREKAERLEQLRAVERGWRIRVLVAERPALGIDTRADYERFLEILARDA
jgi:3-deoxy-manno-octulosonate cytidylyltransferase (CMP-KDO synthetase)